MSTLQSVFPLVLTSLLGSGSKGYIFSLVHVISDYREELQTDRVKQLKNRASTIINIATICLVIIYLMIINNSVYITLIIISAIILLILAGIALALRNNNFGKNSK